MATTGNIPRWMLWLFPTLRGVEGHPLFLRLSGQAYRRRPKWWQPKSPPEFKTNRRFRGVGSWIVLVLLMLVCWPVGLILILLRGSRGGSMGTVGNFVLNGVDEFWGEELALTPLDPVECDRALFAAALLRIARSFATIWGALLMIDAGLAVALSFNSAMSQERISAIVFALVAPPGIALFIGLLLFGLSIVQLALSLGSAETLGSNRAPARLLIPFTELACYIGCMILGVFILCVTLPALMALINHYLVNYPDTYYGWTVGWAALIVFTSTTFLAAVITARSLMAESEGKAYSAMCALIRRRHDTLISPSRMSR